MVFFLLPDGKIGTVASKADKVAATSATARTAATSEKGKAAEKADQPATSMYPVKSLLTTGPVDTSGLSMYSVKPIY
jgi:hypothetical protein